MDFVLLTDNRRAEVADENDSPGHAPFADHDKEAEPFPARKAVHAEKFAREAGIKVVPVNIAERIDPEGEGLRNGTEGASTDRWDGARNRHFVVCLGSNQIRRPTLERRCGHALTEPDAEPGFI